MNESATATNPTEASATSEASATLLASATSPTDNQQQTQTVQAQTPTSAESTASATTESEAGKVAPVADPTSSAVPEKYTFSAPDGSEYDPEIVDAFSGAAREAGLTQDAAQKLIEKMAPAIAARQVDQVQAIHTEWLNASSADKEFGGEKLAENLGVARKALDTFGTPELRTLLDETGLGNHPEVIRLMYRAGKAISEDTFVGGVSRVSGKPNAIGVLYDKTKRG